MPTTSYTAPDLTNFQDLGSTTNNCTNSGTPPHVNFSGSFSDAGISLAHTTSSYGNSATGIAQYLYEFDHSHPIGAITPGSHITRIEIRSQLLGTNNCTATIGVVYPCHAFKDDGTGTSNATIQVQYLIVDNTSNIFSVTPSINTTFLDQQTNNVSGSTCNVSLNTSASATSSLPRIVWDFTTDPDGAFPLGYMPYSQFISSFFSIFFNSSVGGSVSTQWFWGLSNDATSPATGSAAAGCSLQTTNWEMLVDWTPVVTSSWHIVPDTYSPPDDAILELERDEPVNPDEDIESVEIGDEKYEPDDPDVILWFRFRIKIRIRVPPDNDPPETPDTTLPINITTFGGTVPLGSITINYGNPSGIYRIDELVHHDELYDRTGSPTTINFAITSPMFTTGYMADKEEDVSHYTGTRMRVTGSGLLQQIFESLDNVNNEQLVNLPLLLTNNVQPFQLANFMDQRASLRVSIDGLDSFFVISKILVFTKAVYTGWPQ